MTHLLRRGLLIACLSITGAAHAAELSPDAQFDEAVAKETGERNLDAALDLLHRVAGRADTPPELAARARLRSAFILERMGRQDDALAAYQEILTTASKPAEVVQTAQRRLEYLSAEQNARRAQTANVPTQTTSVQLGRGKWEVGGDAGKLVETGHEGGFRPGQGQLNLFAAYHLASRPRVSVGAEGSLIASRGATDISYFQDNGDYWFREGYEDRTDAWSLAGFFQGISHTGIFRITARAGLGVMFAHRTVKPFYEFSFQPPIAIGDPLEARWVSPIMPISLGVDAQLFHLVTLGIGIRDTVVFKGQRFDFNPVSGYVDDQSTGSAIHLIEPYARLALSF